MKRIESVKNERVKAWKKLHSKKGRDQTGRFLIEGEHLIEEAWKSDWKVETVLTTADDENLFPGECIGVSEAVMKELSETKSPQGIVAVCQKKQWHTPEQLKGRFVLLDRVQDPGNVGTIIRTALAADAAGVVLGSGSADLFNAKVIRATQGALFHLPVYMGDLATWIKMLKESDIPVYGHLYMMPRLMNSSSHKNSLRFCLEMKGKAYKVICWMLLRKTYISAKTRKQNH